MMAGQIKTILIRQSCALECSRDDQFGRTEISHVELPPLFRKLSLSQVIKKESKKEKE